VRQEAVVGGGLSPTGGIEDAVLMLRVVLDDGELVCSSALVAPNLVVTARHCVSYFVEGKFTCTTQGELQSVDRDAGTLGSQFDAASIEFYDDRTPRTNPVAYGAQVLSTLSETICTNDLAFVVLDRALALPVLPLRLDGRARVGEPVTLIGYGFDDEMAGGTYLDYTTQPRTHNTTLVIDELGPVGADGVTTAPPRTIVLDGASSCVGDSGGPLVARDTSALLGVDSLADGNDCKAAATRNLFTHVPDFSMLIRAAFRAAGAEPTPEPSAAPPPSDSSAGQGGKSDDAESGGAAGQSGVAANEAGTPAMSVGGAEPSTNSGGAAGEAAFGGSPASEAGAGAVANVGGSTANTSVPAPARATARTHGCAMAPGAAASAALWPWIGLVAVLERIFGLRRRARVRRFRGPLLRDEFRRHLRSRGGRLLRHSFARHRLYDRTGRRS
jgi:hypothetical protein